MRRPERRQKVTKGEVYICSKDWNMALKKLSVKFPSRYNYDRVHQP